MPIVKFLKENKEIEVPEGANLRRVALNAGVNLYQGLNGAGASLNRILNCHGLGSCGSCKVRILKGMEHTNPAGRIERIRRRLPILEPSLFCLAYLGNEDTMRLACQTTVHGDIEVETGPELNLFGENYFS